MRLRDEWAIPFGLDILYCEIREISMVLGRLLGGVRFGKDLTCLW